MEQEHKDDEQIKKEMIDLLMEKMTGGVTAADHLFCWDKGDQAISAERFSPAGDLESPDSITRRVRSDNSSMLASV